MIGGCLFPANRSDRAFEHDGRADRARALMQGGDLLLDLSFFDGRSIALAQEIEPGRADVAFAPDPGIANIACHRKGAGAVALAAKLQMLDKDVKATSLFGGGSAEESSVGNKGGSKCKYRGEGEK